MRPKTPPSKMEEHDLLEWIYENDFDYWARAYADDVGSNVKERLMEIFSNEVYALIGDVIAYTDEYKDYIKDEEE